MEIVVCIKQVPGTTEVKLDENGNLMRDGIDSKMNPYDLYAIETALKIKEEKGAALNVITMGPPQSEAVLREAFMMGADEGYLLTDRKFAGADVLATSYTLAQGVQRIGKPQLIICGKQTTDGDTAQVGPEMAEYMGIPHVANVKKIIEVKESSIVVEMDMPTTLETVEVQFPCLITVEKGIFQPRLPSYKRKKETKYKAITSLTLQDLLDKDEKQYGGSGSPTRVERVFPPAVNTDKEVWNGTGEELADKLFDKLAELKFI
ncbi:electron transfer flavoprotein subunit beta/FixA family protein [Alkaliphilus crotonatoxidans]